MKKEVAYAVLAYVCVLASMLMCMLAEQWAGLMGLSGALAVAFVVCISKCVSIQNTPDTKQKNA